MTKNIHDKLGQGITPQDFMDKMEKNHDLFMEKYEAFLLTKDAEAFFAEQGRTKDLRCEIITADWCGDAARSVPVIFQLMEAAGIPTEVFIVEEHEAFIEAFRVLGGRSVPVVLFTNSKGDVLGQWGPRPAYVQEPMAEFKSLGLDPETEEYKTKVKEVYAEIFRRYGDGVEYQPLVVGEIRDILQSIQK
jgi:hypothetical protein